MAHGQKVEGQKIGKLKTTSEQAKKSQTNKVRHRKKWWLIETTNDEEGANSNNEEGQTMNNEEGGTTNNEDSGEYGVDYQDFNGNGNPTNCRPGKHRYLIRPEPDYLLHPCPPGTEIPTEAECVEAGRSLGKAHYHSNNYPHQWIAPHQRVCRPTCDCVYHHNAMHTYFGDFSKTDTVWYRGWRKKARAVCRNC